MSATHVDGAEPEVWVNNRTVEQVLVLGVAKAAQQVFDCPPVVRHAQALKQGSKVGREPGRGDKTSRIVDELMPTVLEQVVAKTITGDDRDLTAVTAEGLRSANDLDRGTMYQGEEVLTCNYSDIHR